MRNFWPLAQCSATKCCLCLEISCQLLSKVILINTTHTNRHRWCHHFLFYSSYVSWAATPCWAFIVSYIHFWSSQKEENRRGDGQTPVFLFAFSPLTLEELLRLLHEPHPIHLDPVKVTLDWHLVSVKKTCPRLTALSTGRITKRIGSDQEAKFCIWNGANAQIQTLASQPHCKTLPSHAPPWVLSSSQHGVSIK